MFLFVKRGIKNYIKKSSPKGGESFLKSICRDRVNRFASQNSDRASLIVFHEFKHQ